MFHAKRNWKNTTSRLKDRNSSYCNKKYRSADTQILLSISTQCFIHLFFLNYLRSSKYLSPVVPVLLPEESSRYMILGSVVGQKHGNMYLLPCRCLTRIHGSSIVCNISKDRYSVRAHSACDDSVDLSGFTPRSRKVQPGDGNQRWDLFQSILDHQKQSSHVWLSDHSNQNYRGEDILILSCRPGDVVNQGSDSYDFVLVLQSMVLFDFFLFRRTIRK